VGDKEHTDINILPSSVSSFTRVVGRFRALAELAAPLTELDPAGTSLFTIPLYHQNGASTLPAATTFLPLQNPFVAKATVEFLLMFFHSQNADFICFDSPSHFPGVLGPEIRLDRRRISLIIGALEMEKDPVPSETEKEAHLALEQGRTHRAHYLASLAPGGPETDFIKASALTELDLYQEAYDLLKENRSPQALCLLAEICRKSGNQSKARDLLDSVPRNSGQDQKKDLETAWLNMEEGKIAEARKTFETLAAGEQCRQTALFGLAMTAADAAFKTKTTEELSAAAAAFDKALEASAKPDAGNLFSAGNFFLRSGGTDRAELCYRQAARLSPSPQVRGNLALTHLKKGELEKAAAIAAELAFTDPAPAKRLVDQFPKAQVRQLLKNAYSRLLTPWAETSVPTGLSPEEPAASPSLTPLPNAIAQAAPLYPPGESGLRGADNENPVVGGAGAFSISPSPKPLTTDQNAEPQKDTAPLRTAPHKPAESIEDPPTLPDIPPNLSQPPTAPGIQGRTAYAEEMAPDSHNKPLNAPAQPYPDLREEAKRDPFLGRGYALATALEEEFGAKILFSPEDLSQIERKLRFTFKDPLSNPQKKRNTATDCSAFLCCVLQERFKGRLLKLQDLDPWAWPMIFETPTGKITSYPAERAWRLLWSEAQPEDGWLMKYLRYLEEELGAARSAKPSGAAAVRVRAMSHEEKITEAKTEHRIVLTLAAPLAGALPAGTDGAGVLKLEEVLKITFPPGAATADYDWKLLRCYAHLFAEIVARDFDASWYNVEGNDGLWSMKTPGRTFLFPIGKIYKTAASGGSLTEYYRRLVEEKKERS